MLQVCNIKFNLNKNRILCTYLYRISAQLFFLKFPSIKNLLFISSLFPMRVQLI